MIACCIGQNEGQYECCAIIPFIPLRTISRASNEESVS
jgi:hypothetical protein